MKPKLTRAIALIAFCCFCMVKGYSQGIPDGIIFQAMAKDPSGVPAKGRVIHIKDAIIQTTPAGPVVYSETYVLTASDEGFFTITIGKGARMSGVNKLSDIDWAAGPFFLNIKAAIEPTIVTPEWKEEEQYVDMGTSQFWTVPFAFTAARVAGLELYLKATDTTAMLAPYMRKGDTTSLSNRIDQLLQISDTTNMLAAYLRRLDTAIMLAPYLRKGDTAGLGKLISGKLNISDTSALFNAFLQRLDMAGMLNAYQRKGDTSGLSSLTNGKLDISDTANMFSGYVRKGDPALINGGGVGTPDSNKLNISDTLNMLGGYLRKLDAALMFNPYLKKTDTLSLNNRINAKLRIADSANMLHPYLKKKDTLALSNRIDTKLGIADSASMLNPYLKKADTLALSNRVDEKIDIADSASMLNPYLKKADTLALSNRVNEKIGIADSAAMLSPYLRKSDIALINNGSIFPDNNKLNISDTLNMLSVYQRKLDTALMLTNYLKKADTVSLSNRINTKLGIADSANMLNPYLKKTDTLSLSNRIDTKLNTADTANMLSAFYKTATAIAELAGKESSANKSNNTGLGNSDSLFPTQKAVKTYVDSVVAGAAAAAATPDATVSQKGKIQLAGDLTGTAEAPLIADGKITNTKIADSAVTLSKIQNIAPQKILGNPSATTGETKEITLGNGLGLNGDTLNVTGGGSGVSQVDTFTSNIIVYSTNGLGKYSQGQTIPAIGKTAAQVLIDALTQTIPPNYSQPSAGIGSSPSAGTVETGTALNITLSSSFNQNDAGAQTGVTFSKNGSGLGSNADNIASLTSPVSYTATVSYGQGPVKNNNLGAPDPTGRINAGSKTSGAITFTPQAKRYWGYSTSATPTDTEIKALSGGGSELSSAKAKGSFDITISSGSNYLFFAYPASIGPLSSLSVGGFGSLSAFTLITRSFTNAQGYSQSYNIYVSQNIFSSTVSNIITN